MDAPQSLLEIQGESPGENSRVELRILFEKPQPEKQETFLFQQELFKYEWKCG
jgi:hypothetical protein